MNLNVTVKTNIPDVIIDFIEVQLKTGKTVSLNWDVSYVNRTGEGFNAEYVGVRFGEHYAAGKLGDLDGMKITDIGLYHESTGDFHFQIQDMEFEDGKTLVINQPAIPMDCSGMKAVMNQVSKEFSLASRLVAFYKDYDFYGFQDSLQVGETEADAITHTEQMLRSNPAAVASLVAQLSGITLDEDLSQEERTELTVLLKELNAFTPNSAKVPLSKQIQNAAARSVTSDFHFGLREEDRHR